MAYSAEISRSNPTCLLFIIDQSGSMSDEFASSITKANFLADVLNRSLMELVIRCRKAEGVLNYFEVGVIGYSGNGVGPGFGGALSGSHLCEIRALANSPMRVETRKKRIPDGAGGLVDTQVKFPVWFDAEASGGTPMCGALNLAADLLTDWCNSHENSFPPTVIHVTDGEATDGSESDVEQAAARIVQQSTADGRALLLNLHVSSLGGEPIRFPSDEKSMKSPPAKLLFRISSRLPEEFQRRAVEVGANVDGKSKGYVYNGRMEDVVTFFDIGTRPRLSGGDR